MNDQTQSEAIIGDRALAGWELVSVVSSIVIGEWMFTTVAGISKLIIVVPVVLAVTVMVLSHRVRGEGLRDIGFRFDNFLPAMGLLALPMVAAGVLCFIIGWRLGASVNFLRWHSNRLLLLQLV